MNVKYKKSVKSPIRVLPVVQRVHIFFLLRVLEFKGTHSLSPPQASVNRSPHPKKT